MEVARIRSEDIIDKDVLVGEEKIGKVKGVIIDPVEWELTHLEVKLTSKADSTNRLAISALRKGKACCTEKGVIIKVSKKQLNIYLRPL
ncbi:MAG: hypothetical protein AC479_04165 [miscellaneous Crenarchaeota group-6 archaeon AD8-1]|nr:MAG: hypothetical protein AC479_04165 [miscellaneous Crenarchaeota group-6 archaeon AD8-1]